MPASPVSAQRNARLLSAAASTNATSVKASAGTLRRIIGYNAAATARYLKIYDKASAPTVGTDAPRFTFHLPATSGFAFDLDDYFSQGIAFAITGAAADADATSVTAGDVLALNLSYY